MKILKQTNWSSLTEPSAEASTSSASSSTFSASSTTSSASSLTATNMLTTVPAHRATQPNQQQKSVTLYLINASLEVLQAWILWSIQKIQSHQSSNSAGGMVKLFRMMCPDSGIASKLELEELSATKIGYIITLLPL